jgi:hypothetical protein
LTRRSWTIDQKPAGPDLLAQPDFVLLHRVPLIKGKSARESLEEQGLWNEYRGKFPFNPTRFDDQSLYVSNEQMTNDADVSMRMDST